MKAQRVTMMQLAIAASHPDKMKAFAAPYAEMVIFTPSVAEWAERSENDDPDVAQMRTMERNHKLAVLLGSRGLAALEVSIDQNCSQDDHVFTIDGDYSHSLDLFVHAAATELPWLAVVRSPFYVWEAI